MNNEAIRMAEHEMIDLRIELDSISEEYAEAHCFPAMRYFAKKYFEMYPAIKDYNRLVRELDVAINGEDGAAKQASLCDIVAQVKSMKRPLLDQTSAGVGEPNLWVTHSGSMYDPGRYTNDKEEAEHWKAQGCDVRAYRSVEQDTSLTQADKPAGIGGKLDEMQTALVEAHENYAAIHGGHAAFHDQACQAMRECIVRIKEIRSSITRLADKDDRREALAALNDYISLNPISWGLEPEKSASKMKAFYNSLPIIRRALSGDEGA